MSSHISGYNDVLDLLTQDIPKDAFRRKVILDQISDSLYTIMFTDSELGPDGEPIMHRTHRSGDERWSGKASAIVAQLYREGFITSFTYGHYYDTYITKYGVILEVIH